MTCAVDSTESLRLFIMKVHENDGGNYTCEDSYGNIVETFRVIVSTNSEEKWNHSSKHEKIKRLDALKPCESAINRLRVWKKNGKVICVQRSVEDVCGLGEVASDEPIKKESKDLMSHLLPPLLTALMAFLLVILLIFGFMFIRRRNKELNELRQLHTELVEQSSPPSAKHLTVTVPSVKPLHERIDELPFNMNYEVRLHRLTIKKVKLTFINYLIRRLISEYTSIYSCNSFCSDSSSSLYALEF
ncbi:unnamed protein product [Anisakis simplex]|uniref:Ig-like domain-containing protein n=1 Tax=Anisakis simplex TaxID=6269 RepID=A0A0M3KDQ0_ANISI|nr:unnamed protein product [Anisakis simplex]